MHVRVIAEIGQGKGDPGYVMAALERARTAGCWAGKVQLLRPETIAQPDAPVYWEEDRAGIDGQRATFKTAGCLDYDCLPDLVAYAEHIGIELVGTPFDLDAVEAMARAGVPWCKIASGDITNRQLIEACAAEYPPGIILSTGASTLDEIGNALEWMHPVRPFAVLACTLSYPTPDRAANLERIRVLARMRNGWQVGYSDHTRGTDTGALAVAAGARVLEKHYTLDPTDESVPDNAFALDPNEMRAYVEQAHRADRMLGDGAFLPVAVERAALTGARRSLCARIPITAGDLITAGSVTELRPAHPDAFTPAERSDAVGTVAAVDIPEGAPILRSAVT